MPISSATVFLNKWAHFAITLQDFTWRINLNRVNIITYKDPIERVFDSTVISILKIISPNYQTVIKIKEIVMLGHARDIEEITGDFGAQISRVHQYRQILFYYPLIETALSVLTDQSELSRTTDFTSVQQGIYWDFEGRGPLTTDMTQLSTTEEYTGFITRHKALYFE